MKIVEITPLKNAATKVSREKINNSSRDMGLQMRLLLDRRQQFVLRC